MDADELVAQLLVLVETYRGGGEMLDTWIPAAPIVHLLSEYADEL